MNIFCLLIKNLNPYSSTIFNTCGLYKRFLRSIVIRNHQKNNRPLFGGFSTNGKKFICQNRISVLISLHTGAIAQLGERLHGMQEVVGSNPIGSIFPRLPQGFCSNSAEDFWQTDSTCEPLPEHFVIKLTACDNRHNIAVCN